MCWVGLGGFPLGHAISNTIISQTKEKVGSQQQNTYFAHVTKCRLIIFYMPVSNTQHYQYPYIFYLYYVYYYTEFRMEFAHG